jgi:hypothetical protein
MLVTGIYGDKYETPNDLVFASKIACINKPIPIPKNPDIYPKTIYKNL